MRVEREGGKCLEEGQRKGVMEKEKSMRKEDCKYFYGERKK